MNVYEIVTQQIIEKLEQGVIPWQKPWQGYQNGVSKKQYRGMNILLLAGSGYDSVDFFTAKQVNKLGGNIIKGSKGHLITFWKMFLKEENGQPIYDGNGKQKKTFMLRYYKVFNREQCEGLPEHIKAERAEINLEPIDACEALVSGYVNAPAIKTEGAQALYSATFDVVKMPALKTFTSIWGYYSTLFHELTHSTGHVSRLGRLEKCNYGLSKGDRSREELTAEIGASFLCGMAGIDNETIDNSASYIESWLKVFKGDHKFLVESASSAQKAVDHITGAVFAEPKPQPKKKKDKKEQVMTVS